MIIAFLQTMHVMLINNIVTFLHVAHSCPLIKWTSKGTTCGTFRHCPVIDARTSRLSSES